MANNPSQLLPSEHVNAERLPVLIPDSCGFLLYPSYSEITSEGRRITKLDQILLNGNNIAILVPGGSPDPE
ncbi:hypothetical protein L1049_005437 [Liquidambar formosana]|uniref:Uncharacterized protein n=1 Tax=Liquidambar formosana TaxID=63359 RepID=A0AAP0WXM8_LIQFO